HAVTRTQDSAILESDRDIDLTPTGVIPPARNIEIGKLVRQRVFTILRAVWRVDGRARVRQGHLGRRDAFRFSRPGNEQQSTLGVQVELPKLNILSTLIADFNSL